MVSQERLLEDVNCPVCGTDTIVHILDIREMPIHCHLLCATQIEAKQVAKGDLNLGFCNSCGHIYNYSFDPALMEYNQDYDNSLHHSPTFQKYAHSQAKRLVDKYDIYQKDIIEIGSGQGDFLKLICGLGKNRGVGFDPSYIPRQDPQFTNGDVRIIKDYYSSKYQNIPADLVISRHVLEHIHQPNQFIQDILSTLGERKDTIFFIEVPNALYTVENLGIWDLIYEHFSYYNKSSLEKLFYQNCIIPHNIYEEFDGQFLCIEGLYKPNHQNSAIQPESENIEWLKSLVHQFAGKYKRKITEWNHRIHELSLSQKRIVLWGSGSKGVSFLNAITHSENIQFVVDINPRKQSKYVAGTGQKIVPPEFLREYQPDIVLIINPIYQNEINQHLIDLGVNSRIILI